MNKKIYIIIGSTALILFIGIGLFLVRNRTIENDVVKPENNSISTIGDDAQTKDTQPEKSYFPPAPVGAVSVGFEVDKRLISSGTAQGDLQEEIKSIENRVEVIKNSTITKIDSDSDTLLDTDEPKYGTDPKKADTDGDGYTDADEIKNGYNPLGAGKCAVPTCLIKN